MKHVSEGNSNGIYVLLSHTPPARGDLLVLETLLDTTSTFLVPRGISYVGEW